MYELKTNTAVRIAVGPLVDPGDYKTAETSLTVTGMSVEIFQIKTDGSAVARTAFAPTASGGDNDMIHVSSDTTGMYDLELTAAQLNFLGNARIAFYDVDGFLVHWIDVQVVSAAYFDWKYGSTAPQVTLADDAITASKFDESTAYPLKSADTGATAVARTGADSDTLETLSDQVDAVKAKTDLIPASPAAVGSQMDLVNAPNATAVTAIQSGLATSSALTATDGVVDAIKVIADALATTLEADGAVYRFTTNALERAPDAGVDVVEGSYTIISALRLILARLCGNRAVTGTTTKTVTCRDTADTKDRVTIVADTEAETTSVTLDAS